MGITRYGDVTGNQHQHLAGVENAIIEFFDSEGYFKGAEVKDLTMKQLLCAIREEYEGVLSSCESLVSFNQRNKRKIDQLVRKGKLIKIESEGRWSVALNKYFEAIFRNTLPLSVD